MLLDKRGKSSFSTIDIGPDHRCFSIRITRSKRRSIVLSLGQDGVPQLKIPFQLTSDEAKGFLKKNIDWLEKSIAEQKVLFSQQNKYYDGGQIRYLGKLYRLEFVKARCPIIEISGDTFFLRCSEKMMEFAEKQIVEWYRNRIRLILPYRLRMINERFSDSLVPRAIKYRKMKSSLGNCSRYGDLTFNVMLMRSEFSQIDYVIAHELCHLRCWAHDNSFYSLLEVIMPDWPNREERLAVDF